jgi:hypothetical protein
MNGVMMVLLRVHDDWEETGGVWQSYPWPTFAVGGGRPWPEEPVWVTEDVSGFLHRWHEDRDPRKLELWVYSGDPDEGVCYFTSQEPRTATLVREPADWCVMRAVY